MELYQLLAIICTLGSCLAIQCNYGPQCDRPCPAGCQPCLPGNRTLDAPNSTLPTIASPFSRPLPTTSAQDVPVRLHHPVTGATKADPGPTASFQGAQSTYPPTSTYPVTVISPCHPETGECLNGCVRGKHGSMCQNACSSNCSELDCLQTGECVSGCVHRVYGEDCNLLCSSNCMYQDCHQNGTCAHGCIDGFYGDSCDSRCGKNCLNDRCRQNSSTGTFFCLDGCVEGWRGLMCQHRCPVHCLSCHPDIERGSCSSCEQGWSGINCKIPIVNHCKAPKEEEKCTSGCHDGFHGLTCQLKCPDFCLRCEQDGDECTMCHPGRYGSRCDKFCKDCQQALCQIDTGECVREAKPEESDVCHQHAYILDFNSSHCAKHHRQKRHIVECRLHCKSSSCSLCDLGWFGERCTEFCPQNCHNGCNKTGACDGCRPNYYGDKCDLECPPNCRDSSPGEVVCDQQLGHCMAGCHTGWYGDLCNMTCPLNCERNICSQHDGKCTNGCKQGWKWNSHLNMCLPVSFTLLKNVQPKHQPSSCRDQTYRERCEITCSTFCINSSCKFSSQRNSPVCSLGCVEGFFGPYCQNQCPAACRACSDKSVCSSCKSGFYGTSCLETCSSNCKGCWCYKNGTCAKGCIEGYHGQTCEIPCEANCQSCDQMSGRCLTCRSGWCGRNCDQFCGGCKLGICAEDGQCPLGCNPGYGGRKCNESLYENEQPCFKFKNAQNRKKRHACQYGCLTSECTKCLDGFYGDICNERCPINCESTCTKTSGQCDHSCKRNWGPICEHKCPLNCQEGCDKSSGHCYGGCKSGWYGQNCSQKCPDNCFSNICNQDTGRCMQGCTDGWQGPLCNMPCSEGCVNQTCFQDGRCKHGCYSNYTGYFGKCSIPCMETCVGNECTISKSLRAYICTHGCEDGFAGLSCNMKCSRNCVTCEQFNVSRCKDCSCVSYGSECQYRCSETCSNSSCPVCDKQGSCLHGCADGTWGQQCKKRCSSNCIACGGGKEECTRCQKGLYGRKCNKKCSGCQDGDCDQNGKCISGCVHGFQGPACDIVKHVSEWTAGKVVFTIIVLAAAVIYFSFLVYQA